MLLVQKKITTAKKHFRYVLSVTKTTKNHFNLRLRDYILLPSFDQQITYTKSQNKITIFEKNSINRSVVYKKPIWSLLMSSKLKNTLTYFSMFTLKTPYSWVFVSIQILNSMFFYLVDLQYYKTVYKAANGSYIIKVKYNKTKKIITFILPSKKQLVTSEWIIGLPGKGLCDLVSRMKFPSNKSLLKKKKIHVRGVAKNPIDHHNGGRSNRKPLFLNKYNKVAKHNK